MIIKELKKLEKSNASEEEMQNALDFAFQVDHQIIIESFLEGKEVSVAVYQIGDEIKSFPPTEIVTENDFFDYEAKYEGKSQEITPARISKTEAKRVEEIAKKVYRVLGMSGFSRSEFILVDGEPYFLEINTLPGMTSRSLLPMAAQAAGLDFPELADTIIKIAMVDQ